MSKLTTIGGFLKAIKGEQQSDSSSSVDNEDLISDKGIGEEFTWKKSHLSFFPKDVKNFVIGGTSSKFWSMRKFLNLKPVQEYRYDQENIPLYAWNCITLDMVYEDINIVIPKERDMRNFVRVLIYLMDTMNGESKSSLPLQNAILNHRLENPSNSMRMHKSKEYHLKEIKHLIMRKTELRYRIMLIR